MPITSSIDKARRLVISLGSGTLTALDLRNAQVLVRTDPAFDPTYAQLFDVRAVTRLQFTAEDVMGQARNTPLAPGSRRAFVVSSVEQAGLARMFQAYIRADAKTFRIFESPDEALRWLMSPPSPDPEPEV